MITQLKKISIVSIGNILNAFLGVVFLTAVARNLSIEEFGKYALLTTLLVSMSKVVDFGSNSTFVAETETEYGDNIDSFITLKIYMLGLAYVIGTLLLYFTDLFNVTTFLVFTAGIIAYSFNITMFALFQKKKMYQEAVLLNTVPAMIKGLMGVLILCGVLSLTLERAFAIFAGSIYFSLVLYFKIPALYKTYKFSRTDKKYVGNLAKTGFPGGIALIIQHSWPTISNTIAKIAKDFTSAGIFSVADKIANIFTLISVSVFTVLLPENAQRRSLNEKYDYKGTIYIALFILTLAFVATLAGTVLLPIIFGQKYMASIPILWILILSSAFTAIHTFMDNYFYVHQNVKPLMYINVLKLIVMVVCGFGLIKTMDLVGLAYAQLIASFLTLVITVGIINKTNSTLRQPQHS